MPRWIELDRAAVFSAAQTWRDRCLYRRQSIFLDTENLWMPERLETLSHVFDGDPDGRGFLVQLTEQLRAEDVAIKQLAAELFWLLRLAPSNVGAGNKRDNFRRLWQQTQLEAIPDAHPLLSDAALHGLGSGGPGALAHTAAEMQYAARAVAELLRAENVINIVSDPDSLARFITDVGGGQSRQFRHMLLCLLHPDRFERVFSQGHRVKIVTAFARQGWIAPPADFNDPIALDKALTQIIKEAVRRNAGDLQSVDFYTLGQDSRLETYWNPQSVAGLAAQTITATPNPTTTSAPLNLLLYGPPGTGKTYGVPRLAMQICGEEYSSKAFQELISAGRIEFVSFHQSFSYEDFVEGFRPAESVSETNGGIAYSVQSGVFKRIASRATENWERASRVGSQFSTTDKDFNRAFEALRSQIEKGEEVRIETITGIPYPVRLGSSDTHLRLRRNQLPESQDFYVQRQWLKRLWPHRETINTVTDVSRFEPSCPDPSYHYAMLKRLSGVVLPKGDLPSVATVPRDLLNFVIIIDEINRANISKVFGELITLIEDDKRLGKDNALTVTLPYSGEQFGVPPNLYILGTMNTADRSIALLDIALRRRFIFEELMPNPELLSPNVEDVNLQELLHTINQRIEFLVDRDHCIGHAYLLDIESLDVLRTVFQTKVIPLLQEYCYDDWGRIVKILATGSDADGAISPGGHFKFLHLWPGQIPPVGNDRTGEFYSLAEPFASRLAASLSR